MIALSFRVGAAVLALLMLEHVAAKPRTAVAEVPAALSTVP